MTCAFPVAAIVFSKDVEPSKRYDALLNTLKEYQREKSLANVHRDVLVHVTDLWPTLLKDGCGLHTYESRLSCSVLVYYLVEKFKSHDEIGTLAAAKLCPLALPAPAIQTEPITRTQDAYLTELLRIMYLSPSAGNALRGTLRAAADEIVYAVSIMALIEMDSKREVLEKGSFEHIHTNWQPADWSTFHARVDLLQNSLECGLFFAFVLASGKDLSSTALSAEMRRLHSADASFAGRHAELWQIVQKHGNGDNVFKAAKSLYACSSEYALLQQPGLFATLARLCHSERFVHSLEEAAHSLVRDIVLDHVAADVAGEHVAAAVAGEHVGNNVAVAERSIDTLVERVHHVFTQARGLLHWCELTNAATGRFGEGETRLRWFISHQSRIPPAGASSIYFLLEGAPPSRATWLFKTAPNNHQFANNFDYLFFGSEIAFRIALRTEMSTEVQYRESYIDVTRLTATMHFLNLSLQPAPPVGSGVISRAVAFRAALQYLYYTHGVRALAADTEVFLTELLRDCVTRTEQQWIDNVAELQKTTPVRLECFRPRWLYFDDLPALTGVAKEQPLFQQVLALQSNTDVNAATSSSGTGKAPLKPAAAAVKRPAPVDAPANDEGEQQQALKKPRSTPSHVVTKATAPQSTKMTMSSAPPATVAPTVTAPTATGAPTVATVATVATKAKTSTVPATVAPPKEQKGPGRPRKTKSVVAGQQEIDDSVQATTNVAIKPTTAAVVAKSAADVLPAAKPEPAKKASVGKAAQKAAPQQSSVSLELAPVPSVQQLHAPQKITATYNDDNEILDLVGLIDALENMEHLEKEIDELILTIKKALANILPDKWNTPGGSKTIKDIVTRLETTEGINWPAPDVFLSGPEHRWITKSKWHFVVRAKSQYFRNEYDVDACPPDYYLMGSRSSGRGEWTETEWCKMDATGKLTGPVIVVKVPTSGLKSAIKKADFDKDWWYDLYPMAKKVTAESLQRLKSNTGVTGFVADKKRDKAAKTQDDDADDDDAEGQDDDDAEGQKDDDAEGQKEQDDDDAEEQDEDDDAPLTAMTQEVTQDDEPARPPPSRTTPKRKILSVPAQGEPLQKMPTSAREHYQQPIDDASDDDEAKEPFAATESFIKRNFIEKVELSERRLILIPKDGWGKVADLAVWDKYFKNDSVRKILVRRQLTGTAPKDKQDFYVVQDLF
jgi:hypothetical protein